MTPPSPGIAQRFRRSDDEDGAIIATVLRPKPDQVPLASAGVTVPSPPPRSRRNSTKASQAFLAGEARPLELRRSDDEDRPIIATVLQPKPEEVLLASARVTVLSPPPLSKRNTTKASPAFLAGEARPLELPDEASDWSHEPGLRASPTLLLGAVRVEQNLEKRPDSSRARLGLRVSMVVGTDVTPWEGEENVQNFKLGSAGWGPVTSPVILGS